jgi:hypothetical protein
MSTNFITRLELNLILQVDIGGIVSNYSFNWARGHNWFELVSC